MRCAGKWVFDRKLHMLFLEHFHCIQPSQDLCCLVCNFVVITYHSSKFLRNFMFMDQSSLCEAACSCLWWQHFPKKKQKQIFETSETMRECIVSMPNKTMWWADNAWLFYFEGSGFLRSTFYLHWMDVPTGGLGYMTYVMDALVLAWHFSLKCRLILKRVMQF